MKKYYGPEYLKKVAETCKALDLVGYFRALPQMIEWDDAPGTKRFDLECRKGYDCLNELHRTEDEIIRNLARYALSNDLLPATAEVIKCFQQNYLPQEKIRKDEGLEGMIFKESFSLDLRRMRNKTPEQKKAISEFFRRLRE